MKPRSILSLHDAREGASAVEFALVAPLLMAMLLGIFEYGRLYWTIEALHESAIAGARCMGIRQASCASGGTYSSTSTQTYIQNVAKQWAVVVPTTDINLNNNATCGTVTGLSQVTISYTFKSVVPAIIAFPGAGETLTATACFPNNPPTS